MGRGEEVSGYDSSDHHRKIARASWANPDVRERRIAAIRAAWDDPLRRALMSAKKVKSGSRRESSGRYD